MGPAWCAWPAWLGASFVWSWATAMEIGQSACSIRRPQDCPVRAVLDGAASAALRFDGLGAVSAGGTSRYLYDYAEPIRSEILDLLFLPGYAASIQVLKVEIGGDAQSGFGVQPSHRREANETRCERGDTFWLIREARRRNPQLVLVASPWTFPPWVGVENATQTSFYNSDAIDYILSWIACANATDAGRVDFLGGRPRRSLRDLLGRRQGHVAPPVAWVWELRTALASAEVPTQLVLPDAEPDPLDPLMDANELLGAYGLHYPCFLPMPSLQEKGLPFWSTEDGGMLADWAGAACAGRSINTNLVRMNATSTLLRSLVWAVHPALPGPCDGLLDAREPWSGRYAIQDPLWILAHTTRFTQVGWHVLPLQSGASGHLKKGGTVVCYLSPDRGAFTLVVEKLQAPCQSCPGATTGAEEVVFHLAGGLESKWVDESDYPEPGDMIRSESASTSASTGSSEFQGFKVRVVISGEGLGSFVMFVDEEGSDQVTPLPQKAMGCRGHGPMECWTFGSRSRESIALPELETKELDDHEPASTASNAVLPDEVHEVTCIRAELGEEYYPVMGEDRALADWDGRRSRTGPALVRSSKEEVAKTGLSCIELNDTTFCMVEAEFHHLLSAVASDVMSLGTNPKESKEILKLGQEAVAGSDEDLHYATASEPKPASTAFQKPKKAAQASSSSEDSSELGVGVLRPDVVLDNPFAVPESWEDSIDVEPTVTATMAMCIECCDHFDVALGAFVILCGPKDESSAVD
ncbi:Galactocerebrosidase (GALCERase) (Galactocerebroside beta-galactosidase) (Galactosylceramidase) (Galactosylceramide beta-galactosidase) [Durusdinium trenchii]|uniref:galactosylceramidase n=1 Tax=Durusdinium trenchii TaxID=1381693 RepID=A0ABP0PHJ9_9DINO